MEEFWVIRDGKRSGPFSEEEVMRRYREGTVRPSDLLWAKGIESPVRIADAFAQLGPAPTSSDVLSIEPLHKTGALSLEPLDTPAQLAKSDASPYRPPAAALEEDDSMVPRGNPRYAGFWVRYSANVLDTLIVTVFTLVVTLAFDLLAAAMEIGKGMTNVVGFVIGLVLTWLYIARGESSAARATPGKRVFHLQAVDAEYLDRISFLRATGRFFGRYLSAVLLMIGYLMQPFNARKRALHDFLSGTVVVVARAYSRGLMALMILLGLGLPLAGLAVLAAVGVPAYQDYVARQKVAVALMEVTPVTAAVQQYLSKTGQVPNSLEETGYDTRRPLRGIRRMEFDASTGIITVTLGVEPVAGSTVLVVPDEFDNGRIYWGCRPGTLSPSLLPPDCPPGSE